MHGPPLQSIHSSDLEPYHIPMRLLTVALAPKAMIDVILKKHKNLQNLVFNRWVKLVAIDPTNFKPYQIQGPSSWREMVF